MNTLNTIKRIISLPLRLAILPFFLVAGFFMTDWRDGWERDNFKKIIVGLLKG